MQSKPRQLNLCKNRLQCKPTKRRTHTAIGGVVRTLRGARTLRRRRPASFLAPAQERFASQRQPREVEPCRLKSVAVGKVTNHQNRTIRRNDAPGLQVCGDKIVGTTPEKTRQNGDNIRPSFRLQEEPFNRSDHNPRSYRRGRGKQRTAPRGYPNHGDS